MAKKLKATETSRRIELVNKYGSIARPFEEDAPAWEAQGWKRVAPPMTEQTEEKERNL